MSEEIGLWLLMSAIFAVILGITAIIGKTSEWLQRPPRSAPAASPPMPGRSDEAQLVTDIHYDRIAAAVNASFTAPLARVSMPTSIVDVDSDADDLPHVAFFDRDAVTARAIGIGFDGQDWISLDLDSQSHWAVVGTKGSGKGNTLLLMAASALALGPEVAQVWVCDPKDGIDYRQLTQCAHARLYADVPRVGDDDQPMRDDRGQTIPLFDGMLADGYSAAITEMHRRNRLIGEAGCTNRIEYNQLHPDAPIPALLLIADEVADLPNALHEKLATIARMSRSAGIILVVATQYPTATVLDSQIQANVDSRIVLRVASSKYALVSLGVLSSDQVRYDPSQITERGVAVARIGETQSLIRIPEVTGEIRRGIAQALTQRWPRTSIPAQVRPVLVASVRPTVPEAEPVDDMLPSLLALMEPTWNEREQRLALYLFAQLANGRSLSEDDLSMRELARVAYPDNKHNGGGGYLELAEKLKRKVFPRVETWLSRVNIPIPD